MNNYDYHLEYPHSITKIILLIFYEYVQYSVFSYLLASPWRWVTSVIQIFICICISFLHVVGDLLFMPYIMKNNVKIICVDTMFLYKLCKILKVAPAFYCI